MLITCGCGGIRDADAGDADRDGETPDGALQCSVPLTDDIDVLLVWDNSGAGWSLQERFLEALPALEAELPPSADVHVGAVSADLGAGGYEWAGCVDGGDGGMLREAGGAGVCYASGAPDVISGWLSRVLPESDVGCGVEMFIEATLSALGSQSAVGMANEGFLRDGSVVVVLFVGNEDDCSTSDSSLFDPEDSTLEPIDLRCALHHDRLADISGLDEQLRALRAECPERLVLGGVLGVPDGWDGDVRGPELQPEVLPGSENLTRVCDAGGDFWAYPAPRLAELVATAGDASHVASVCASDYAPALAAVGRAVASAVER